MNSQDKSTFARRLVELRKSKNLSQYQLAEEIGFSRGLIANYEQGRREPDYLNLQMIADYFNVTSDYLLGRTDAKQYSKSDNQILNTVANNPDLLSFIAKIYERDSMKKLFKQLEDKDDKTIYKILNIIKLIEDNEDDN